MGDGQREFKINITADASGAITGSVQSAEALDRLKQRVNQSSEAMAESDKETEHATFKKTELKKIVRELSQEFPVLGEAARFALNPLVFSVTALIGVFAAAKKALEDWNAEMDAASQRNASRDFLAGIEAKRQALGDAAAKATEFAVALGNVGKAEDNVKNAMQHSIDKLHEFGNAQAEVNNAAEARDLARVDLAQKSGRISETQAIEQRAVVKERYRKANDELKTRGENDELAMQEEELRRQQNSTRVLAEAAGRARTSHDSLKARRDQADADLKAGEVKLQEYRAAEASASEGVDKARPAYARAVAAAKLLGLSAPPTGQADRRRFEEASQALDRARDARAAQEALNAKNLGIKTLSDQSLLPVAAGELATAEEALKRNRTRIVQLQDEIPANRAAFGIRQEGRALSGSLAGETANLTTRGELADKLNAGRQRQQQLDEQILKAVESGNGVSASTLNALQELTYRNREIEKRIQSLEGTRKANPPNPL